MFQLKGASVPGQFDFILSTFNLDLQAGGRALSWYSDLNVHSGTFNWTALIKLFFFFYLFASAKPWMLK